MMENVTMATHGLEALLMRLIDNLIERDTQRTQEMAKHLECISMEIKKMSAQLDALKAAVAQNAEVDASAIALIQGIAQQLQAIKDDPAAIQALADELMAKNAALAAAVTENTPAG
jgi:hypothetical protein